MEILGFTARETLMRRTIFSVVLAVLLCAMPVNGGGNPPQHEHLAGQGHAERPRDPHTLNLDNHHHIGPNDWRLYNGRDEVFFSGSWFYCDAWPTWMFTEDVYVIWIGGNEYFFAAYDDPTLQVTVFIEENK